LAPPDSRSAATAAGLDLGLADRMVKLMLRERRCSSWTTCCSTPTLERLKSDVRQLKATGAASLDVAFFKERYGLSRKFAIPLLEYLDRERVTRRVGDARVIL
jgi:selenocysteine-specific elongation factor